MDAVLAFLKDYAVVVMFVWGLLVKYWPALAKVPNTLIPWLNVLIGLLGQLGGGAVAPPAVHTGFVAAGFAGGAWSFLGPVIAAGWQAVQASLIYEVFGRHLTEKGLGWTSPPVPSKP